MSIFGEPLPHEDDTATSLIRREGYPPLGSYDQMPQVYVCPCCSAINPNHDHDRLLRTAKEEKEMERRRLMQLDIFDERARPLVSESAHSRKVTNYRGPEEELQSQALVPPPPMTLDELRKMRGEANKTRLIVTVHQGKNINVHPRNPTSVLVHCGSFEGQTAKIPRGTETTCTWEELFEFPYPSEDEPLEILVIDDTLPAEQDHILGGVVVPPYALRNRARGDEEVIPICPQDEMHRGYGRMRETPMGSLLVSWYLKHDGEEADPADGKQNLESPVNCVFIVHRIFQYTDSGAVPFESGVLCVLRDTDDNCSASTECHASGVAAMSTSPYYTNEGYNYLPEPPSQTMQLITEKRLGHVLVCVPKGDGDEEEAEELLVVGAVPLDFGELYHKGSAVLLIESKVKEDVLWGEVALEWRLTPHENIRKELEELQEAEKTRLENEALKNGTLVINESLFVTVARGLRLKDRDGVPLSQAQVSLFAGDMEGSTFVAPSTMDEDGETNVITWNQEVRFMDMEKGQSVINVHVLDNNERVSSGSFELEKDHGYAVVKVFDPYDEEKDLGEILVAYNRVRTTTQVAKPLLNEQQNNTGERTNSQGQPGLLSEERDRSIKSRDNQYYNGEGKDGLEGEELSNGLHGEEGEDGSQVRRMANEGEYPVDDKGSRTSSKQQRSPQELHGEEGEDGSQVRRMANEGEYPVDDKGSRTSSKQQRSPQELHGEEGEDGSQVRRMANEGEYPVDDKGSRTSSKQQRSPQELHGEEGEDGSQVRRMANEGEYPVDDKGSRTSSKQQRSPQELHGEEGEDGSQVRRMANEGEYPVDDKGSRTSSKQHRSPQELHGEEGEDGSQVRRMANEGEYPVDDKGSRTSSKQQRSPQELHGEEGEDGSQAGRMANEGEYPVDDKGSRTSSKQHRSPQELHGEEGEDGSQVRRMANEGEYPVDDKGSRTSSKQQRSPQELHGEEGEDGSQAGRMANEGEYPVDDKGSRTSSKQHRSPQELHGEEGEDGSQAGRMANEGEYPVDDKGSRTSSKQQRSPQELHGEEGEDGSQAGRMANEGEYPVDDKGSRTSSKQHRSPQELHGEEGEDGSQAGRMANEGEYPVDDKGSRTSSKQHRSPQELHGEEGEDGSQAGRMANEGEYPVDDKGRMSQWEHSVGEGGHGAEQDGSGKQRISQQRGKADDKAGSESKRPRSVRPTFDDNKSKTPRGASATAGAAPVAGSDRIPGVSGQKTRVGSGHGVGSPSRRDNNGGPKTPAVQQPWFPARSTGNEDHIPLDKRESFLNRADAIRDLERRSRMSGRSGDRRLSRQDPTRD